MSKLGIMLGIAALLSGAVLFVAFGRTAGPLADGNRVPNFTLPEDGQGSFAFRQDQGHVVVLNFWATWCAPCVAETPSLEKFAAQVRPLGVRVIGVSVDQNLAALQKFTSAYQLTYPILRDPNQVLASRFGTYKFPETYILDRDGRLADKIIGATDWNDPSMFRFVEALLHWPPPAIRQSSSAKGNW
jgi:cytochrome c biogenesis protein CcmG, thiol:disulfide interchange protein DsbE